jgi:DNA repair protein RecN (Recombination protein N)
VLVSLSIRDLAIIRQAVLSPGPGFTVLTGETGAGKSILVDALGLVLGDRPHADQVRTGAREASVEAVFAAPSRGGDPPAAEAPAAAGRRLVLSRRIARSGRHQSFVDGAPASQSLLAQVGADLVDIHGQHQHQSLLRTENHVLILDAFGGLTSLREEFTGLQRRLAGIDALLARREEDRRQREVRRDFLLHQAREIEAAGLSPGEEEELEEERRLLLNAERIGGLLAETMELLYQGEAAATGQVEAARGRTAELARYLPEAAPLLDELDGAANVLREAVRRLEGWQGKVEGDPERLNGVEERLDLLARLKRKYGDTVAAVVARERGLREELAELDGTEATREALEVERQGVLTRLAETGSRLSQGRSEAARKLGAEVTLRLGRLGMERARFGVSLDPRLDPDGVLSLGGERYRPGPGGLEEVEFLFSANPGEGVKSLARVASGGELSRVMLAIKSALAGLDRVPTLIFDEIDTGIGGGVARTVGRSLRELAAGRQVICVTHLPQIAALADDHLAVRKVVREEETWVEVEVLAGEARVAELARMMAGDAVTAEALAHARRLLERAG